MSERQNENIKKRKQRESARDVGRHTASKKLKEKRKLKKRLIWFLKIIFPLKFFRPFSKDQKEFIADLQKAIIHGGELCCALPRGEGKTTIIVGAIIWAILYGYRKYLAVIAAEQGEANKILEGIKIEMTSNEKLKSLFPEACHYISKLESLSQRATGQLSDGKPTHIKWKTDHIIFPQVKMNKKYLEVCSGAVIEARGLTGRIRGMHQDLIDGRTIRPDFVLLDDPQTRESAKSPQQCTDREDIINADVMGLAGIGLPIAAVMAVTVICENDLADRFLNKWQSTRGKALYDIPEEHDKLWKEYIELRRKVRKEGKDKQRKESNAFYRKHKKKMDKGARVGNKHRLNKGDVSALQAVYNYIADNGFNSFWSELQNDPQSATSQVYEINLTIILSRTNGHGKNVIPEGCHFINAAIDVNYYALNWGIAAITNQLASFGIDYGRYPRGRNLWDDSMENITAEQAIYDGVIDLVKTLHARQPELKLVGVDGNYATDTVYRAVEYLERILPIRVLVFRGVGSEKYSLPYSQKNLINKGYECHLSQSQRGPNVIFNSHYWHMHLQKGFLLNPGSPGSFSFWGDNNTDHRTVANHILADKLTDIQSKGGKEIHKWVKRPGDRNDLGDAFTMTEVGASIFGADINFGKEPPPQQKQAQSARPRVQHINL
jgi:hypothetical protein